MVNKINLFPDKQIPPGYLRPQPYLHASFGGSDQLFYIRCLQTGFWYAEDDEILVLCSQLHQAFEQVERGRTPPAGGIDAGEHQRALGRGRALRRQQEPEPVVGQADHAHSGDDRRGGRFHRFVEW